MKSTSENKYCRAQTFLEYMLVFGVVASVLVAMTPLLKRSTQGLVKVVADHVGNQKNAEQLGGTSGHLVSAYIVTRQDKPKSSGGRAGDTIYGYCGEVVNTQRATYANAGFTTSR